MSKGNQEMEKQNELKNNKDIESQALEGRLLNTLIYLNIEWADARDGMELENIIHDLGEFYNDDNGYARYQEQYLKDSRNMGREDKDSVTGYKEGSMKDFEKRQRQYRLIKAAIERDAEENDGRLGSMTIANQSWNMGYDKKGLNACTFEDTDGNIMVVYRGTGSGEWGDNGDALAGLEIDSEQQRQALEYFDEIMKEKRYYEKDIEIILTGHSKGGNKAQYTTINSKYRDFITNCFSYDGQGFSPEAIAEFRKIDNYEELLKKIYSFNGENDFVNPLGEYIIHKENRDYYQTVIPMGVPSNIKNFNDLIELIKNIKDIGDLKNFHYPDSCLTDDGRFSERTEQGFLSLFVEKFSEQALTLPPEHRDKIFSTIMGLMQGSNETVSGDNVFSKKDVIATLVSLPVLLNFAGDSVLYATREKHGALAEFGVALTLARICPVLFADDLLKIRVRNLVDCIEFSIDKLKDIGELIIQKIEQFSDFIKDIGESLSRWFGRLMSKTKEAFKKLITYAKDLKERVIIGIKSAAHKADVAIENFINKITTVVSNFFSTLVNGVKNFIKYCKEEVVNAWDKVKKKASQTVDNIIDKTKEEIQKRHEDFKNGLKYVINYKEEAIKNFGDKKSIALEKFRKKVMKSMLATVSMVDLMVNLSRLQDLRKSMKKLETEYGERIHQILSEAKKITSETGRRYNEYYVRQRIEAINKICEEIRYRNRIICEMISRKTNILQYTFENYKKIEMMIEKDIKSATI